MSREGQSNNKHYGAIEEGSANEALIPKTSADSRLIEMAQKCGESLSSHEIENLAEFFSSLVEQKDEKPVTRSRGLLLPEEDGVVSFGKSKSSRLLGPRTASLGEGVTEEEFELWKEYVEDDLDVGMFTLFFMAPQIYRGWKDVWIPRFLISLVLFVQFVVPIVIVRRQTASYDEGFCPADAGFEDRLVAFSVGAIYVSRLSFIIGNKIMGDTSDGDLPLRREWEDPGPLLFYIFADRFMDVAYEGAVYILNLWLVFAETADPIDMIWNSLALEFILQFDDEIKDLYLRVYPVTPAVVSGYMKENNDKGTVPIGTFRFYMCRLMWSVKFSIARVSLVLVYIAFFFMPLCKPGLSLE